MTVKLRIDLDFEGEGRERWRGDEGRPAAGGKASGQPTNNNTDDLHIFTHIRASGLSLSSGLRLRVSWRRWSFGGFERSREREREASTRATPNSRHGFVLKEPRQPPQESHPGYALRASLLVVGAGVADFLLVGLVQMATSLSSAACSILRSRPRPTPSTPATQTPSC